ncbi:MAG: carboxypeptidase regulatory-like domain-containing protein [Actinobacteria bacterium]|nr:carboxypeptidase regulatory-like domain-containing protein [Actinomycetota bacterium]
MSRDPNASYNSRNPYIYTENNPVNLVDPTGLAPTGVIRGKIKNAEGKPVAVAAVRIGVTVISTNSNGEFQFTLVESGIYTIYYDAAGYGSQVQQGIAVIGTTITPTVIMSPSWSNAIGQPLVFKAGGADGKSGYTNYNVTAGAGVGVTAGALVEDSSGEIHPYIGTGFVTPGASVSKTNSSSKITTGYSSSVQAIIYGFTYQFAHNFGANIEKFTTDDSWSTESGVGISATRWSISYAYSYPYPPLILI